MTEVRAEMHILLVEDNQADADLATEMILERKMGTVAVARDGEAALAYLRGKEQRPDLILLDLNLPKVQGRQVLQEVKTDSELKRIPVIVFTSSGADNDIDESYELSANCYIKKPIDFNEFSQLFDLVNAFWLKTAKLPPRDWRRKSG